MKKKTADVPKQQKEETMNLSKFEKFSVAENVSFGDTTVSVNPGTKVTSIVPQWGRMEVTSMEVTEGHLCVSLCDYPFDPLEGTGSLIEVLSLIGPQNKIVIAGDGFTICGGIESIKPLVKGLLEREVGNCFAFKDEDDTGNGYINIRLKSPEKE